MNKKEIIVVDDESDVLNFIGYNLRKEGYTVSVFNNGASAMDYAINSQPDLVISDWWMPEKSGIELLQEFKQKEELREVPFIMITCNDNEQDILEALEKGADDYLIKPFKVKELKARVKNRLNYINKQEHLFLEKRLTKVSEQNKDLLDSLKSAKRIQTALLPNEQSFMESFPSSFIFNQAHDWVSGDFFWYSNIGDFLVVAVADCTGHGVPGAFMSILGNTFLNQIVNEKKVVSANEILYFLNVLICNALNNAVHYDKPQEGMDIGICVIDRKTMIMQFSGAFHQLYFIRDGILEEYKGSRFPIGGLQPEKHKAYSSHIISLKKGDKIYLKTDGYTDQFGGPENRKFSTLRFRKLLNDIHYLPMFLQLQEIKTTYEIWKGTFDQTDDILVFGMEL